MAARERLRSNAGTVPVSDGLSTVEKVGVILGRGGMGAGIFILAVAVLYSTIIGSNDRYKGADAARDQQKQALIDAAQDARIKAFEVWKADHSLGRPHRDAAEKLAVILQRLGSIESRLDKLENP